MSLGLSQSLSWWVPSCSSTCPAPNQGWLEFAIILKTCCKDAVDRVVATHCPLLTGAVLWEEEGRQEGMNEFLSQFCVNCGIILVVKEGMQCVCCMDLTW